MSTITLPAPMHPLVLLERRDYVVSAYRVVSLCVVSNAADHDRTQVRLYCWRGVPNENRWNVALCKVDVSEIDLEQMASDAKELAARYGVELRWDIAQPSIDTSLDDMFDSLNSALNVAEDDSDATSPGGQQRKVCPGCGSDSVLAIVYGIISESRRQEVVMGGLNFSAKSPLWQCQSCGNQFGRISWKVDLEGSN